MVNTAVNLAVMGIQSVDHVTYMGMFETEKTHVAEVINKWNLVGIQYLYGTIQVPNSNF